MSGAGREGRAPALVGSDGGMSVAGVDGAMAGLVVVSEETLSGPVGGRVGLVAQDVAVLSENGRPVTGVDDMVLGVAASANVTERSGAL